MRSTSAQLLGQKRLARLERTQAPTIVTIKSTDRGFDAHACKRWTSDLSRITKSTTRFGPGTYIVKTDIKPGAYVARCSNWATRLRAFTAMLAPSSRRPAHPGERR